MSSLITLLVNYTHLNYYFIIIVFLNTIQQMCFYYYVLYTKIKTAFSQFIPLLDYNYLKLGSSFSNILYILFIYSSNYFVFSRFYYKEKMVLFERLLPKVFAKKANRRNGQISAQTVEVR